jgi:hypothetical protein
MKTVLVTQSNYIPWRGWFDMLRAADEVVLLDCVQYTRRDWRNRNVIKTPQGTAWLTVPVETKGRYSQAIDATRIADPGWAARHIGAIESAYRRAPAYAETAPWLFGLLEEAAGESLLSAVNERLIRAVCARLGIAVPLRRCSDVLDREALRAMDPTERLVSLAGALGAARYLSGPAARAYLDLDRFAAEGIDVVWMSYEGYPEYPQLWGPFEPRVSVIDLLLNTGRDAARYLGRNLS